MEAVMFITHQIIFATRAVLKIREYLTIIHCARIEIKLQPNNVLWVHY